MSDFMVEFGYREEELIQVHQPPLAEPDDVLLELEEELRRRKRGETYWSWAWDYDRGDEGERAARVERVLEALAADREGALEAVRFYQRWDRLTKEQKRHIRATREQGAA